MELTKTNYIGKTIANLEDNEVGILVKSLVEFEATGNTPTNLTQKMECLFNRLAKTISPEGEFTNTICTQAERQEIMQLLRCNSYLFNEKERGILKGMLETSWARKEKVQYTPFMFTAKKMEALGYEYGDLCTLRNYLKSEKILAWRKIQSGTFEYKVTYYTLDEPKLLESLRHNVEG